MNVDEIRGQWNTIRGKLKERWQELSDDDLRLVGGNVDQVIGRIERRTGEPRRKVESLLDELTTDVEGLGSRVTEMTQRAATAVSDTVQQSAEQLRQQAGEQYERAERYVAEHPGQSIAVVFGCGVLTGLALSVLLRR